MEELFKQVEKKGLKVVFGLESQGHIPTIQAEIKRWNDWCICTQNTNPFKTKNR